VKGAPGEATTRAGVIILMNENEKGGRGVRLEFGRCDGRKRVGLLYYTMRRYER
jgi:hypothetical protein